MFLLISFVVLQINYYCYCRSIVFNFSQELISYNLSTFLSSDINSDFLCRNVFNR
jgi:hypothetical protein